MDEQYIPLIFSSDENKLVLLPYWHYNCDFNTDANSVQNVKNTNNLPLHHLNNLKLPVPRSAMSNYSK